MASCKYSQNEGYRPGAGREYCGTQLDWHGPIGVFGGLGGGGIRTFFTFEGFGSLCDISYLFMSLEAHVELA
jgi:hypothetical protein